MSARWLELGLVGLTLGGLGVATRMALWPLASSRVSEPIAAAPGPRPALRATPPESLAAAIARRDPFRVSRRPAVEAYRVPTPPPPPPPPLPQVQKPNLSLIGMAWGTANGGGALIEGFPGIERARAVRVGDLVAGIRVQQIAGDSVVLAGLDTVWVLRVRREIP